MWYFLVYLPIQEKILSSLCVSVWTETCTLCFIITGPPTLLS